MSSTQIMPLKKVLVPVANGSEPMESVIPIDILQRAGAEVTIASVLNNLDVCLYNGVTIVADALLSDCVNTVYDLICLPGGIPGADNLRNCELLENMMKKQASEGRAYAAICAAPALVLGPWGLLKGLKATCYPKFMDQLSEYTTATESRVEQDGNVITSRAPGTAIEYSIALVTLLFGKLKADQISRQLVRVSWPRLNVSFKYIPLKKLEYAIMIISLLFCFRVQRSNHTAEYRMKEFNPVKWTFNKCPKILVPVANGVEGIEVVTIVDILREASAEVVVASVEDKLNILASNKVKLTADSLLEEAAESSFDLIVLPGGIGGAQAFAKSEKLVNLLKKQSESNKPYGAISESSAEVLEPHGLLKGKNATKLAIKSKIKNKVVINGNVITSTGPGTSLEFSLSIVEKLYGRDKACELAQDLLFMQS